MSKKQRKAIASKNLPNTPFSDTGYYRCPKCFKERSKMWFCYDCGIPTTRISPAMLLGVPFHDFQKTVKRVKREIIIGI